MILARVAFTNMSDLLLLSLNVYTILSIYIIDFIEEASSLSSPTVMFVITVQFYSSFGFTFPFCRAMLCKRVLCRYAVSVYLSVRLSVTLVNSVKTSNRIFNIFLPSVAKPF